MPSDAEWTTLTNYLNGHEEYRSGGFDGYIAKTKTCEDGTPVITERYKQKYDAILAECIEIIENEVKAASAEE